MTPAGHRDSVLELFDAFNARDVERFVAASTDDVEVESRFSKVFGATYRSRSGVVSWWADLADVWETLAAEFEDSVDIRPDRSVILATLAGRGRESGLDVAEPIALRMHWRGTRMKQMQYMDRVEAERIVHAGAR